VAGRLDRATGVRESMTSLPYPLLQPLSDWLGVRSPEPRWHRAVLAIIAPSSDAVPKSAATLLSPRPKPAPPEQDSVQPPSAQLRTRRADDDVGRHRQERRGTLPPRIVKMWAERARRG
jgi:hypothetical protein